MSIKEVISAINGLRSDSAAGPDKIHPKLLKAAPEEVAIPLAMIFKKSLESSQIPMDWKTATVVPIYKKGPKGDPGNYRPVSLTSVPGKLLEKIIKKKLVDYLESNNLIKDSQHGFTAGRSCTTNLITFLEEATKTVDSGIPADIFYLDFAKAFDKVPHERLLCKLEAKGVGGALLEWVRGWLSGRRQQVKVGEATSGTEEVKSGVPQGSVLGPVLFIIFIDDIDEAAAGIQTLKNFADDTKGLQQVRTQEEGDRLQTALNRICEWAKDWAMEFNIKKCKIMHLGRNNPERKYYMEGEELQVVEEEKDIGVVIHKSLKPSRQCETAAGTANRVLAQIRRNFHYRDKKVFKQLYCHYVRPHLEFAVPAWNPWLEGDIQKLEQVQVRAVAMISGLAGKSYEEKLRELGMESLKERRERLDLTQAFKIIKGLDRIAARSVFEQVTREEGPRTRLAAGGPGIVIQRAKTDMRKNFFTIRMADKWNKLDTVLKEKNSIAGFKNAIRSLDQGARP